VESGKEGSTNSIWFLGLVTSVLLMISRLENKDGLQFEQTNIEHILMNIKRKVKVSQ
jgi:hypothetical protein